MATDITMAQLRSLLTTVDGLTTKFDKLHPTEEQWKTLCGLANNLLTKVTELHTRVGQARNDSAVKARAETEGLRNDAQNTRAMVLSDGLKGRHQRTFRTNITVIFMGPPQNSFQAESQRKRNEVARKRCEELRQLSPDGIISWALAYPASLWAGSARLRPDHFACLAEHIEPDLPVHWPRDVRETLRLLEVDSKELQSCIPFKTFREGKSAKTRRGSVTDEESLGRSFTEHLSPTA